MSFRKDMRLLGMMVLGLAAIMFIPAFVCVLYGEIAQLVAFCATIAIMGAVGGIMLVVFRRRRRQESAIGQKDGFFFVTMAWLLASATGALPLVLSGEVGSYSRAFFEIMSGFTTTGATMLTDIEAHSHGILFWRSMTNWLGGMGIVVLFVALLPALGSSSTGSFALYGAESSGVTKGKLTPKTSSTAVILWLIYLGLTVLEVILLMFGGLSLYDAVTVSFSTASAAGFCVRNASIAAFQSAYAEVVVTIFMFLAGVNFALYYKVFTGRLRDALHDGELRLYFAIFAFAAIAPAIQLTATGTYGSFLDALRHSAFASASVITTTGFSTADYTLWPSFSLMCIVMLMFIGGSSGSAAGGIKVTRLLSVFKNSLVTMKRKMHPAISIKTSSADLSAVSFVALYFFTWLAGVLVLSISGQDLATCMAASISTLGNIGIGFGGVGPAGSFAIFPTWTSWVFSFLMLVGRLELFTVYILFTRDFRN